MVQYPHWVQKLLYYMTQDDDGCHIAFRQMSIQSDNGAYKQCLMTYKAIHIGQPNYLNELIQPYEPVRTLRSSTSALLVIPFVRSDFASDAVSVSAPTLWNNLPQDVRSCAIQATFKSRLKSHLFSLTFTI